MYVTAIGLTVYSQLAFGLKAAMATTLIGALYSSPSDIQDLSDSWRRIVPKLDAFQAKLDALEKDVPEEDWKEMSRPEFQQVKKDFLARKDDSKPIYTGVADVIGGLSDLSFAMAVFSLVGASGMAMWATTIYLTRWNAALALGGQATGNMYVQAFTNGLKALATQHRKAVMISAGVAIGAGNLLATFKSQELTKQTAPEKAPDFTQVYLEGLPQDSTSGTGLPKPSPSPTASSTAGDTTSGDTTEDTTVQAPGPTNNTVAT
ncbi:hypothetical protein [Nonomuraea indica]|uniref:Uncharacterized protein n=1 Tax=Nonomuraea indica TaxID=1581193 RepID=A0ABW8A3X8_9ACTN